MYIYNYIYVYILIQNNKYNNCYITHLYLKRIYYIYNAYDVYGIENNLYIYI